MSAAFSQPGPLDAPLPAIRLLLIDDDPAIATVVERHLCRLGGESRSTADCTEMLELIAAFDPTHIMVDLFMPGQTGMGVAQVLAQAGVKTPIILSSGGDQRLVEAVARSARAHGLTVLGTLAKPFSRARLAACLGRTPTPAQPRRPSAPGIVKWSPTAADLGEAIAQRALFPVFQPKVCCTSEALLGFEVLARWHHPAHGIIMPDQFIALAESSGQMEALTATILDQALNLLETHADSHWTLAFNISPRLLEDGAFARRLIATCTDRGIDLRRVVLEVTEGTTLNRDVATLDLLTDLRLRGVGLSLDDFGIGYSSLTQLAHLPFSEIKIDKSFVMATPHSLEARAIVGSIVTLAHSLGMTTVAEGVEDEAMLEVVRQCECDQVQGYYFAKPMPAAQIACWQREHSLRRHATSKDTEHA